MNDEINKKMTLSVLLKLSIDKYFKDRPEINRTLEREMFLTIGFMRGFEAAQSYHIVSNKK